MFLALACAFLGCTQPLPTAPDDALFLAQGNGGVTVGYFCGNTFQFRNRSTDTVTVQWRVHGVQESGELVLTARGGAEYSETYLTTHERGPLQVSRGGLVLATVPNKHTEQCEIPATDTTRPPIPAGRFDGADSAFVVASPTPGFSYFRRFAGVLFRDTVSGLGIRQYLLRNGLTVTGGFTMNGAYIVKFADPGESFTAFNAKLASLAADPRVRLVIPIERSTPPPSLQYVRPTDGTGFGSADWVNPHPTSTWALRAVHAPDAWGCATGTALQSGQRPRIGVVEWGFGGDLTDLAGSVRRTFVANGGFGPLIDPNALTEALWHGKTVAEVATGTGSNGFGIPGVTWSSDLYLYGLGLTEAVRQQTSTTLFIQELLPEIEANGIRALNFSIDFQADPNYPAVAPFLQTAIEGLLQRNPNLTIVKSIGNEGDDLTPAQVAALNHGGVLLIQALSAIKSSSSSMAKQIIFVAGTWDKRRDGSGGEFWTRASGTVSASTFIRGQTDIAAPAALLTLPGNATGSRFGAPFVVESGTSFAAPMVLGAIAELLSNDPSLTPEQVLRALVDGAEGLDGPLELRPAAVNGAPETVYQLNVYRSLRLVSRSAGTPLCGNRLWSLGNTVYAERTSGPEPVGKVSDDVGQILPYHGGRKVLIQKGESARFAVYELGTGGVWDSTGLWDRRDSTGLAGSGLSALGFVHDRDSVAFLGTGGVKMGTSFFGPARSIGPVLTGTTSASGATCVVEKMEAGKWRCDVTVYLTATDMSLPSGVVTPVGETRLLWAQESVKWETTVQAPWLDCWSLQPANDNSTCRFHERSTTVTPLGSSIWEMDRAATGNGTPRRVFEIPDNRLIASITASEDGGSIAIATGASLLPNSRMSDCQTLFYSYDASGQLQPSGATRVYGTTCTNYNWQGGFGAVQQQLTAAPEPSNEGFALQARLVRSVR
jgi:hypothetical protein